VPYDRNVPYGRDVPPHRRDVPPHRRNVPRADL
jgi:hypothetical protein